MTIFDITLLPHNDSGGTFFVVGLLLFFLALPYLVVWFATPSQTYQKRPADNTTLIIGKITSETVKRPSELSTAKRDKQEDGSINLQERLATKESPATPLEGDSQWRCVCETSFLPKSMLQSLGGAEAAFRMSTGQCYHKRN
jgi:hypothetical protein